MFHAKIHLCILTTITLFTCSNTLLAMKTPQKIIEIKDHKIEIKKYIQKTKDIIIPESLKVFYAPFLNQKNLTSLIIPIDTKKVLFFDGSSTKIWDLTNEKEYAFFKHSNTSELPITKLTNDSIFFRYIGGFVVWNFEKNTQKTFTMKNNQNYYATALQLTETSIAAIDQDGIMDIIDLQNGSCLKSISSGCPSFNLLRLSKTKLISLKDCSNDRGSFDVFILWDLEKSSSQLITTESNGLFNPNKTITSLTAISDQTLAFSNLKKPEGFPPSCSILVFNPINTNLIQKIKHSHYKISEFLLHLPKHNTLVSCNTKFYENKLKTKIIFLNLKNPATKILKIDLHTLLSKKKDKVASMTYHEKENTIMITTENGFIITVECENPEESKDLNYLFQNLKISKNKKPFKDLGFKFK